MALGGVYGNKKEVLGGVQGRGVGVSESTRSGGDRVTRDLGIRPNLIHRWL